MPTATTSSTIPTLGAAPMLLRAVYRGVNYHEPVTPGKTTVDVQVFEPTDKPGAFAVTAHAIILQPDGSRSGRRRGIQHHEQDAAAAGLLPGGRLVSFFAARRRAAESTFPPWAPPACR